MKDTLGKIIAILVPVLIWIVPVPTNMSFDAFFVLIIFVVALYLWMTVGIHWPSLWVLLSLMLVPKLSANSVLSSSFGNQTFVFLLFTFILTHALAQTAFIKRVALWFVCLPFAKKSIKHLALSFWTSVLVLGMFMSPTVLFFILMPILEEILGLSGFKKGDKYSEMMVIGLVLITSLSSGMTLIAHVFPVLALGTYQSLTGNVISDLAYMKFAIPFCLLIALFVVIVLFCVYRSTLKDDNRVITLSELELPSRSKREQITVFIFMLVVTLWIIPDFLPQNIGGVIKNLGTAFPPLLGVVLLSIFNIEGTPLINVNEALTKGVSWPSLLMTAAALALGSAMTHPDIGLTTFMVSTLNPVLEGMSPQVLVIIFVFWAALQSNVSSHMVTAQLVSSVAIPIFLANPSLNPAAITVLIGILASFGSGTPPAMPYVAFAVSSGWSKPKSMFKVGIYLFIVVVVLSVLLGYPLASSIL